MAWVWPEEPLPGEGRKRPRGRKTDFIQEEPATTVFATNKKSEQGGIDFRTHENLTSLTAPFGTTNTPIIGTKIIGGEHVPVIEHLAPNQQNGHGGISITRLNDIADKPNNINPDLLRRGARGYFSAQQDNFQSNLHGRPTYYGKGRPDSKSLERGRKLPPLQTNRNKNQLSTIFEPEVGNPNALRLETEYGDRYVKDIDFDRPASDQNKIRSNGRMFDSSEYPKALSDIGPPRVKNEYYRQSPAKEQYGNMQQQNDFSEQTPRTVLNEERSKLLNYLWNPGHTTLPSKKIQLMPLEEEKLGHIVSVELEGIPRKWLDKVHADVISADWEQNGTCSLIALKRALEASQIRLDPDTVRLVAAKFVDRSGWIFYRDFIRYLKKFLPKEQQTNFEQRVESRPSSPLDDLDPQRHHTLGKTLQIARQHLEENDIKMNISAISNEFAAKDKPHTGLLSEGEIMDVMYKLKIPLPRDVIQKLLKLDSRHRKNGQYNWPAFLDVLGLVQPVPTGLELPPSKRPLQYAKPTLEPNDSWPRKAPRQESRGYDGYRQYDGPLQDNWRQDTYQPSFGNGNTYPSDTYRGDSYRHQDYNGSTSYRRENSPTRAQQMSYRNNDVNSRFPPIGKSNYYMSPRQSQEQLQYEIDRMENEIKELQEKNEELNKQKMEDSRPFHAAITSLAATLYEIDERKHKSTGRCHISEVLEETVKHRIPLETWTIQNLAEGHRNAKGMVDIANYLAALTKSRK